MVSTHQLNQKLGTNSISILFFISFEVDVGWGDGIFQRPRVFSWIKNLSPKWVNEIAAGKSKSILANQSTVGQETLSTT
jgi:arginine exporter protein ArgO